MQSVRQMIEYVAQKMALPGEDLEAALLTGGPKVWTSQDAERLADWLDRDADSAWGRDPRHADMAAQIRRKVSQCI